jgi:hypothetical protein
MHALSTAAADQVGVGVCLRHPEAVPRQPLLSGGSFPFLGKEELPNVVLHDLGLIPWPCPGRGWSGARCTPSMLPSWSGLIGWRPNPRLYGRRPLPLADGR